MLLPRITLLEHLQLWTELGTRKHVFVLPLLSRASIASWGKLVDSFRTCATPQCTFIHPMSMSSRRWRYFLMFKSEASPCSSSICFQISWNIVIFSRTICFTTLIYTIVKYNDILNRLFDGEMNLWYIASISLSQIPSLISCPPKRRRPSCFKILMTFYQAKWYSPILIF